MTLLLFGRCWRILVGGRWRSQRRRRAVGAACSIGDDVVAPEVEVA